MTTGERLLLQAALEETRRSKYAQRKFVNRVALVLSLLGHVDHGKRDRRIGQVGDQVDLVDVEPFAGLVRRDVGLVLVIDIEHLDPPSEHRRAEILDGHADCKGRSLP